VAVAVTCAALALWLPSDWYTSLPRNPGYPQRQIEGTTVLRLTFAVQSAILLVIAATGWKPPESPVGLSTGWRRESQETTAATRSAPIAVVLVITLFGLALRLTNLDADLWLDEIATVATYAARPLAEVYGSYLSPGNHLLNSLLLKLSVFTFGESEWSVRLPAALLGVATIPALYWVARMAMTETAAAGAAMILSVSYHHIFFSQNARGYSGFLLFTLLSTGFLASALRRDRAWKWAAYAFCATLGFAALMITAFVVIAHAIVAAFALGSLRRRGVWVGALGMRLILTFAAAGFLSFQIYAVALPDVVAIYPTVYSTRGSGYAPLSLEFLRELLRGLSEGFQRGVVAVPFVALAAVGFLVLLRRHWVIASSFALALAATVGFLIWRGQSIAPRFLLPGLLLAILSVMATIDSAAAVVARRRRLSRRMELRLVAGTAAVLAGASLLALPSYYAAPKQPYRAALNYIDGPLSGADPVIVVYPATGGFQYYLRKAKVRDSSRFRFVQSPAGLDSALAAQPDGRSVLVTTLFRALRAESSDLADLIERDWIPVAVFRGTLGDGDIRIWRQRDG